MKEKKEPGWAAGRNRERAGDESGKLSSTIMGDSTPESSARQAEQDSLLAWVISFICDIADAGSSDLTPGNYAGGTALATPGTAVWGLP